MANVNQRAESVNAGGFYAKADFVFKPTDKKMYLLAKRAMDIFGASAGILFCLPLIVVVSVLIKLESPRGPVFFKQIRIGKDGKPFYMYKLRSMVPDSEERLAELLGRNEVTGAMFKIKDDPRITRVGKVIRKISVDELPQLWNVLRNDMSLVGPRPSLPREVEQYTAYDKMRMLVMPGCTGLWQVSGRNRLSFEQMVKLDLHYIANRSLWFDIKLMLKTFGTIFNSDNAY